MFGAENPVIVQVALMGFFQTGVFATSVTSQQSSVGINLQLAAMSFLRVTLNNASDYQANRLTDTNPNPKPNLSTLSNSPLLR